MFVYVVIGIAVVSVLWSLWSLWQLQNKKHLEETKKELFKGRVVFQNDESSSSE